MAASRMICSRLLHSCKGKNHWTDHTGTSVTKTWPRRKHDPKQRVINDKRPTNDKNMSVSIKCIWLKKSRQQQQTCAHAHQVQAWLHLSARSKGSWHCVVHFCTSYLKCLMFTASFARFDGKNSNLLNVASLQAAASCGDIWKALNFDPFADKRSPWSDHSLIRSPEIRSAQEDRIRCFILTVDSWSCSSARWR